MNLTFRTVLIDRATYFNYIKLCSTAIIESCGIFLFTLKHVAPKKAKLAEAESSLNKTINVLNAKRAELKEVEDRVESLKKQFAEMTEKKKQLEFQVCSFQF